MLCSFLSIEYIHANVYTYFLPSMIIFKEADRFSKKKEVIYLKRRVI